MEPFPIGEQQTAEIVATCGVATIIGSHLIREPAAICMVKRGTNFGYQFW